MGSNWQRASMLGTTGDLVYQALSYRCPIGVSGEPASVTKATFPLLSNHPNPVRGRTNITFDLPKAGAYEFRLFNIAGADYGQDDRDSSVRAKLSRHERGPAGDQGYLYSVS